MPHKSKLTLDKHDGLHKSLFDSCDNNFMAKPSHITVNDNSMTCMIDLLEHIVSCDKRCDTYHCFIPP